MGSVISTLKRNDQGVFSWGRAGVGGGGSPRMLHVLLNEYGDPSRIISILVSLVLGEVLGFCSH